MDSEDAPDISTVRASFLSELSGKSTILVGKVLGLNLLTHMHTNQGLFGGCNQILRVLIISLDSVKFVRKVIELTNLVHDAGFHEVGWLD